MRLEINSSMNTLKNEPPYGNHNNIPFPKYLNCVKYTRIQGILDSHFHVKGQDRRFYSYTVNYGSKETRILACSTRCYLLSNLVRLLKMCEQVDLETILFFLFFCSIVFFITLHTNTNIKHFISITRQQCRQKIFRS